MSSKWFYWNWLITHVGISFYPSIAVETAKDTFRSAFCQGLVVAKNTVSATPVTLFQRCQIMVPVDLELDIEQCARDRK